MKDKSFDQIRNLALIKTQAENFFDALHKETVSTTSFCGGCKISPWTSVTRWTSSGFASGVNGGN